jgi:hypothetical protein
LRAIRTDPPTPSPVCSQSAKGVGSADLIAANQILGELSDAD